MTSLDKFNKEDVNVLSFMDWVQDIYILNEGDIEFLDDKLFKNGVYKLVNYIDVMFIHLIDLVDIKLLSEDRLNEILFSVKCVMSFITNNFTAIQEENVIVLINEKLLKIKYKAVEFEYFEIAANFQKFITMYNGLFK